MTGMKIVEDIDLIMLPLSFIFKFYINRHIQEAIENLSMHHLPHIKVYDPSGGVENKRRLVGDQLTSDCNKFTSGVANRHVSVRIPRAVSLYFFHTISKY